MFFLQISVRDYGIPIKKEIDNLLLTKRALSRIVLVAHFVKLKSSAWFMSCIALPSVGGFCGLKPFRRGWIT